MAEPADIESLARRFLDLWQEQLAAVAADPEFANSADRILKALDPGEMERAAGDRTGTSNDAPRPSAAGTASGNGDDVLRRIERRLAALEKRLDALETGTAGQGGGTRGNAANGGP